MKPQTLKPWTAAETAYLIAHYPHQSNTDLGAALGRTKKQITTKAERLREQGIDLRKSPEVRAEQNRQARGRRSTLTVGAIHSGGKRMARVWTGAGFMELHRWNYEQANGPLGRHQFLDCIDGNPRNYDASNWKIREPKPQTAPKVRNAPAKLQVLFGSLIAPIVNTAPKPAKAATVKRKPAPRPAKPAPVIDFPALITFALAYLEAPTVAGFAADQGMIVGKVRDKMESIRTAFKKHPTGFVVVDGATHNLREIAGRSRKAPGAMPGLKVETGPARSALKREESKANQKRRKRWTHTPDGAREMEDRERQAAQVAGKVPVYVPAQPGDIKDGVRLVRPQNVAKWLAVPGARLVATA